MANFYDAADKTRMLIMIYRRSMIVIFCLGLFTLSTTFILFSSPPQASFAQPSSSLPETPLSQEEEASNQPGQLEAARQEYLSAWNNTAFSSEFDIFVAEGTVSLYGVYREHIPANVFRPGETIVLYVEPVGYGHQPIADSTNQVGENSTGAATRTLYLINMTADIMMTDLSGAEAFAFEDVPVTTNLISHRQITEIPMTLTVSQEEPFPVGDYIITYGVHDQVTGQSFQIDREITIDENATTGAAPLPDIISNDDSMQ
jgi:hypothetical protein